MAKAISPNVVRMKILGANVIPATAGLKTLKEAVDAAFGAYVADPVTQFYAIGSVVGSAPVPDDGTRFPIRRRPRGESAVQRNDRR